MSWMFWIVSWFVVGFLHALYEIITSPKHGNEHIQEWIVVLIWFTVCGYAGVLVTLYEKITERL